VSTWNYKVLNHSSESISQVNVYFFGLFKHLSSKLRSWELKSRVVCFVLP